MPLTISTVPPRSGPDHGDNDCTVSESTTYATLPDVYSRPFVLASTMTPPASSRAGDAQTRAASLTNEATLTDAFHEHTRPISG